MGKVNPKEHYRRMATKIPTLGFRVDKEEMVKFEEMAKNLQISKSMLGRGIMNSIFKAVEEKKLKISSNEAEGTISIKFSKPMNIEVPKVEKPKLTALKFGEEAYKHTRKFRT